MTIDLPELEKGTKVRIKRPKAGERGLWTIVGRVPNSGTDDPAYDVTNDKTGRRRIFRRSRMEVKRGT